jgi:hypothetical protein
LFLKLESGKKLLYEIYLKRKIFMNIVTSQKTKIKSEIITVISYFFVSITCLGQQQLNEVEEFTSSNLPIIVINTNSQTIVDEPKITANMGIINNGEGNRNNITDSFTDYNGYIGIELRGNSTQNFPKKPYLIETRDSLGENLDVSLLGMPEDNDWILLASYIDRTFIRDPLAHYLSTIMGKWSNRSRSCEVVINGEYMGVYILIEKIKRGKNRLDIKKLTADDTSSTKITGGYIYEITGFGGDFGENRLLHYPDIEDITDGQLAYIKKYDDDFRAVMLTSTYNDSVNGYEKYIDTDSFIDEIIIQELMRNSDAYGWSGYFHKNRDQKLNAGPVWDFDQSSGNSSYMEGEKTTGWILGNSSWQPFFWKTLFNDSGFNNKLRIRWNELRKDKFSDTNISAFIDSCAGYLEESQDRNFTKWPILGVFTWRETTGYEKRDTYQKEVDYFKNFMVQRAAWMDSQLKVETSASLNIDELPVNFSLEQNYPNPFNPSTVISFSIPKSSKVKLKIYDVLGREVAVLMNEEKPAGVYTVNFNGNQLACGVYIYSLQTDERIVARKMLLLK